MLELNNSNYFSLEADQHYMSNSQYKDFVECEARAMEKLTGSWKEPPSEALLLGSYVHAWAEGTLDEFKTNNPELFTKKGELYAQYKHADKMIETLAKDPFIMFLLQGEKEKIITAEFAGAVWKAKLDVRNEEGERIVDLKTVRDIRGKHWDKELGCYVSFVEAYGYLRQMALYAELERIYYGHSHFYETYIVAVSKEDPPDKEVIGMDQHRMEEELAEIERRMPRVLEVKSGNAEPKRCENCRYCRETKKVTKVVHYMDLLA
ncbi:PD-(D/E)XK nuclease-like domain-containing protein [Brevibacillus sp. HD3.3A]|uniref:PD-(D/E)XK nuclease-like domain-containing protein n=1 Tax=Brevibacillus sp. HD3.3A TaxID=2738979 RepID=UPI00156B47FA|nr:PD-(D/E)XK nuclease-like domain-containing protein [Brevibacillus sp. HD3.3A]UED72112.1 PD-(D/E)XK nuclease-like domain-containing protein [Brevibacillus sp. HD3.3A]